DGSTMTVAGSAALGAVVQELLYWYNLRHSLDERKYRTLVRSPGYWLIMTTWVVASGILSLILLDAPSSRDAFVFGIALPLLIKQIGQAQTGQVTLGSGTSSYFSMR
ncbi:MAG TPA: hypothetical protein VEA77_00240, partial [Hyphomicrobium sp.]|nr:hypothetical protein [Hyphomicrobium sp.]